MVCHHHHVCLHEGGFSAARGATGTLTFFEPDGTPIEPHLPPPELAQPASVILRKDAAARGLDIRHHDNLVRHNGSGLDLNAAVDAILPLHYKLNPPHDDFSVG